MPLMAFNIRSYIMSNKLSIIDKFPLLNSNMDAYFDVLSNNICSVFDSFNTGILMNNNIIEVEVPGFTEQDISINVDNNFLTVKGERKRGESVIKLNKTFNIDTRYRTDNIDAKLENGLLTLTLSKKEDSSVKEVPINKK